MSLHIVRFKYISIYKNIIGKIYLNDYDWPTNDQNDSKICCKELNHHNHGPDSKKWNTPTYASSQHHKSKLVNKKSKSGRLEIATRVKERLDCVKNAMQR